MNFINAGMLSSFLCYSLVIFTCPFISIGNSQSRREARSLDSRCDSKDSCLIGSTILLNLTSKASGGGAI